MIFEKETDMKKHKHCELIKAWADGEEIEYKNSYGEWERDTNPEWNDWSEYRIKPNSVVKYFDVWTTSDGLTLFGERQISRLANISLTFDSETNKLKGVELL